MTVYIPTELFYFSVGFVTGVVGLFPLAVVWGKRRGL